MQQLTADRTGGTSCVMCSDSGRWQFPVISGS